MGQRFAELAFTPLVKEEQRVHGSRHLYERVEQSPDLGNRLDWTSRSLSESAMASTWVPSRRQAGRISSFAGAIWVRPGVG